MGRMAEPRNKSGRRGSRPRRDATRQAVAQASRIADAREAARSLETTRPERPARERVAGERDPFTGELRRREILPLLVLHFMKDGPSYGHRLMEQISAVTAGVVNVNPNTTYPPLPPPPSRGPGERGAEHPEPRSRRSYALTDCWPAG